MTDDNVLFQVTVVVPATKLGTLLSTLPPKLNPQIARLLERDATTGSPTKGKTWKRQHGPNGEYQPAKGTTGDALYRYIKNKAPMRLAAMREALCRNDEHKPQGVGSALNRLVKFKLVKHKRDGTYEVVK